MTGSEPLHVDFSKLKLDLSETKKWYDSKTKLMKTITLKEAVEDIVKYFNYSISISEEESVKWKRLVNLITFRRSFDYTKKFPAYITPFKNEEEEEFWVNRLSIYDQGGADKSWLERIINSLMEEGYVANRVGDHGSGIFIQV